MTKVPAKAAWEYCIYVSDNQYGYYKKDGSKVSMPFDMAVQKIVGDSGSVKVKISKSFFNNTPILRYTITSFSPELSNLDSIWQGGSSAVDVFPGTPATFGGEINGYGQISGAGILSVTEYTIYYVYDGINPIVEYPASGNPLASYVYAGGLHIGKIAGPDSNWYHCDALGSPRKMTDEFGATVTWSASYYPFGEVTASGTRTNTHQFTGKEMDAEMGLNYFCQRYYDPQIGRFMTLDKWTCLPDDDRHFGHTKYLSWDSYLISYTPQVSEATQIDSQFSKGNAFLIDDAVTQVNPTLFIDKKICILMNKQYNNNKLLHQSPFQLNRYAYCYNNPLIHLDPLGNIGLWDFLSEILFEPFDPTDEIFDRYFSGDGPAGLANPFSPDASATHLPKSFYQYPPHYYPPPIWPFPGGNPWL